MHDWMPGMGWWVGPIFMTVFWILVILGVVYLFKGLIAQKGGVRGKTEGS